MNHKTGFVMGGLGFVVASVGLVDRGVGEFVGSLSLVSGVGPGAFRLFRVWCSPCPPCS